MKDLNSKYLGCGGQSLENSIQGFSSDDRKTNSESTIGKFMGRVENTFKQIFGQGTTFEAYRKGVLNLIQNSLYIEEWIRTLLAVR